MKKNKKRALKILKWGTIAFAGYWIVSVLIFGQTNLDSKTGMISFRWSGIDALFSDEDFGFFIDEQYKTYLKGVDGPYIFDDIKFEVNEQNKLVTRSIKRNKPIEVSVNNSDKDRFKVTLKDSIHQEIDNYPLPIRLIAISDIEGNYNAFSSFLFNNKVIDENYNWIYGAGHLVLNGDFFDRGESVSQVLWLIYMLEEKAEKQGGKVHFINGNHETMNLYGDISYTDFRYVEVAKQISHKKDWDEATRHLYSEKSELGKWLRSKNIIEKIGDYVFVHGGLNKKHVEANLNISKINKIAKEYYGKVPSRDNLTKNEKLVLGASDSPYWDRGLSMGFLYKTILFFNGRPSHKTTELELDEVLNFYDAEKIVVGHSVVDQVITDYNGKAIKIDVKHGIEKNSSNTQGLLIENGIEYRVDGLGKKEKI